MPSKRTRLEKKNQPTEQLKRPRRYPSLNHNVEKVAYRFGWMDSDCPWGWNDVDAPKLLEIQQKLGQWEGFTWGQLLAEAPDNQHDIPVTHLIPAAMDRLVAKNLDDLDSLFRFRLSGKERLWGARMDNIFYLIWWDPEHLVCPSSKK
jgi:hypothetical protein